MDGKDVSMDDTILETLHELKEREGIDQPEAKAEAPEAPEVSEETKEEKPDRPRDATGKFVKKDESAAPAQEETPPTPPESSAPEVAAEPPLVTTTGQVIDLNRPPASWKPAAKTMWAGLPEPIRAEIYRRESDFLNGNKGLKEHADFGQSIRNVVEPYRMLIESEGGTPEQAVGDLLKTAATFRIGTPQQKLQNLFAVADRFNVPLREYFEQQLQQRMQGQTGQSVAPQPQVYQDPRVDQILSSMHERERQEAVRQEQISNLAVERFIGAKDDKGQPLHPFVDNVLEDMQDRIAFTRKLNPSISYDEVLKQAYEAAVWANPETRAVLMSQQQAKAQADEETLRKVEAAKRASGLNMPKRGALPAGEVLGTMDDTIRDTLHQLRG